MLSLFTLEAFTVTAHKLFEKTSNFPPVSYQICWRKALKRAVMSFLLWSLLFYCVQNVGFELLNFAFGCRWTPPVCPISLSTSTVYQSPVTKPFSTHWQGLYWVFFFPIWTCYQVQCSVYFIVIVCSLLLYGVAVFPLKEPSALGVMVVNGSNIPSVLCGLCVCVWGEYDHVVDFVHILVYLWWWAVIVLLH